MRPPVRPLRLLSFAALIALGVGCGAGHDAAEKELSDLRAEVTRLRAAQSALTERVDKMEIDRGAFAGGAPSAAPTATPAAGDRPELSVVHLSPSEGDGDADNDGPRPVIRATGGDGSIQRGDAKRSRDARSPGKKGASATPKKSAGTTVKP